MSRLKDQADAVAAILNAAELSQSFTAAVAYDPYAELADLSTLSVMVVPRAEEEAAIDRSQITAQSQVDIGIRKALDAVTPAAVDPYLDLCEEIKALFRRRVLDTTPRACWTATTQDPTWFPDDLADKHQFTAVITLTFLTRV